MVGAGGAFGAPCTLIKLKEASLRSRYKNEHIYSLLPFLPLPLYLLKTKKLKGDGFNILRVREEPLKKISDSDIMSKQPFNAKEVTNNILIHIMNSFELEDVLVKKIKAYISIKKLQNEKGLDEYIEMIK